MLTIQVPQIELLDNETSEFIYIKAATLKFENSLVSISKWEQKWKKPFPGYQSENVAKAENINFSPEEFLDYIQCMCVTQNVDPLIFRFLPKDDLLKIRSYIEDPMTATKIKKDKTGKLSHQIVTNELVYFWMTSYHIPFEPCQKWHINRLLTLINVAAAENAPKKNQSRGEIAAYHRAMNAARRKPKKP